MPKLYEDALMVISQPLFGGWKVVDKMTGATLVPNRALKEKVGLVWLPLARLHKDRSINPRYSEMVMFQFFGLAVMDPSSEFGQLWAQHTPKELIDLLIEEANTRIRDGHIDPTMI